MGKAPKAKKWPAGVPFTPVPDEWNRLMIAAGVSGQERGVLEYLLHWWPEHPVYSRPVSSISKKTGLTEARVRECLHRLCNSRMLPNGEPILELARRAGKGRCSTYLCNLPSPDSIANEPKPDSVKGATCMPEPTRTYAATHTNVCQSQHERMPEHTPIELIRTPLDKNGDAECAAPKPQPCMTSSREAQGDAARAGANKRVKIKNTITPSELPFIMETQKRRY